MISIDLFWAPPAQKKKTKKQTILTLRVLFYLNSFRYSRGVAVYMLGVWQRRA